MGNTTEAAAGVGRPTQLIDGYTNGTLESYQYLGLSQIVDRTRPLLDGGSLNTTLLGSPSAGSTISDGGDQTSMSGVFIIFSYCLCSL